MKQSCEALENCKGERVTFPGYMIAIQVWAFETFPSLSKGGLCKVIEGRENIIPRTLKWEFHKKPRLEVLCDLIFYNDKFEWTGIVPVDEELYLIEGFNINGARVEVEENEKRKEGNGASNVEKRTKNTKVVKGKQIGVKKGKTLKENAGEGSSKAKKKAVKQKQSDTDREDESEQNTSIASRKRQRGQKMKAKGKQAQQIAKKKAVMKKTKRRPVNAGEGTSKCKSKGRKARESNDDMDSEEDEREDESGGLINAGLCTKEAKIIMKKISKQTTRTVKIMADVKEMKRRQVKQEVVLNKILRFMRDLTRHQMNRNEGGMPGQEETVEDDNEEKKENADEGNEMKKGDEDEDDDLSGARMEEKNQKEKNANGAANDVEQPEGVVEEEENREGDKIVTEQVNASVDRNGKHHVEKEKVIGKEDDMPNFDIFSFQTQPEVEGTTKENEASTEGKEEREKNEMNTEKEKAADMWGMGSQEDSQLVKEVCKNVEEVEKVALQSTDSEK
ncbi:unnamed protein product [Cuscuta europaea]|uniref:Uncharacterized protein n=1 Tax=Cuscuta europaea TaxID=41803 RepID=A0A9P1E9P8_CUSEU|nr:unnamed protein product [Cuscuta europaea]